MKTHHQPWVKRLSLLPSSLRSNKHFESSVTLKSSSSSRFLKMLPLVSKTTCKLTTKAPNTGLSRWHRKPQQVQQHPQSNPGQTVRRHYFQGRADKDQFQNNCYKAPNLALSVTYHCSIWVNRNNLHQLSLAHTTRRSSTGSKWTRAAWALKKHRIMELRTLRWDKQGHCLLTWDVVIRTWPFCNKW